MLDGVVNATEIMAGEKDPDELAAKALDDKTFEVTLVNDLNYFEELCAFPAMMPVREDMIEKQVTSGHLTQQLISPMVLTN